MAARHRLKRVLRVSRFRSTTQNIVSQTKLDYMFDESLYACTGQFGEEIKINAKSGT